MDKQIFSTAAGWVAAAWTENGLAALILPQEKREKVLTGLKEKLLLWGYRNNDLLVENSNSLFPALLENALVNYFQGKLVNFDALPVDLSWGTPFQRKVLQTIRKIPFAEVRAYGQVAAAAGYPDAARAVGKTAGINRTPIVIPCHRVIRQNGELGGFRDGLQIKKYLLSIEAKAKNKKEFLSSERIST